MANNKDGDLTEFIDKNGLDCLNEDSAHPVSNILQPNQELYLASDPSTDEQLIVRMVFQCPVKISGVLIQGVEGDPDSAPAEVKIFRDQRSIGFDEADDAEAAQAVCLSPEDSVSSCVTQMRLAKFTNVTSLQFFIASNHGSDVTKIARITPVGSPGENMKMSELKKVG